jgi:hypothetical protein
MAKESSCEVALEIGDGVPDKPFQPSLPKVLVLSNSGKQLDRAASPVSPSPSPSPSPTAVLVLSNSGKGMDQSASRKKYVKQVRDSVTDLSVYRSRGFEL